MARYILIVDDQFSADDVSQRLLSAGLYPFSLQEERPSVDMQARILDFLGEHGPATAREVARKFTTATGPIKTDLTGLVIDKKVKAELHKPPLGRPTVKYCLA